MSKLREAAERVLACCVTTMDYGGWMPTPPQRDALNSLRSALSEPDLEGAVIEAAEEIAMYHRSSAYSVPKIAALAAAVDALNAAERPRYEAWPTGSGWIAGIKQPSHRPYLAADANFNNATYRGPDAERHAREWADRMNERRE